MGAVVPQRKTRSDLSKTSAVTPPEALENEDFYTRLRTLSSRRTSVTNTYNTVKDNDKNVSTVKLRKRSVTSLSTQESVSSVSSTTLTTTTATHKISPYKFDTTQHSNTSNETELENHDSSRKDIQEALDEEKRKREE